MIPKNIEKRVLSKLKNNINQKIYIQNSNILYGGSINNNLKLETNYGNFFLKWNNKSDKLFKAETKGLTILKETDIIYIPEIINSDKDFLLLEFIEKKEKTHIFWENFGRKISEIHRVSNDHFGLDHDNFIGSLDQENGKEEKWIEFFIKKRIKPQLRINEFPHKILNSFDKLFLKIENLFPEENPALLHGDLWSGNFICSNNEPVLIDPAIYFGHREMDISMTKLFGGFNERFYESYNENYSLSEGWIEREKICNLYPLLVHAKLFGGHYYKEIERSVQYFI